MMLPDTERLLSKYLRAHAAVAALVGDRVYTAFPAQAGGEPLVLLQRAGGTPPLSHPLVVDEVQVQIDCYGGTKAQAWTLAATVLDALDALEGYVDTQLGSVSAVRLGAVRWMPDDRIMTASDRSRPRYIADVTLTTRPALPAAAKRAEAVTSA